jgi:hypothetical protein
MTDPRKYPQADVKILYGRAAVRCALPNCRRELTLEPASNGPSKQIGKIAHIVAHSSDPAAPRSDPSYPNGKLDTYENWILLCPTCHEIVDARDSQYTVESLRKLKADHELWVCNSLRDEIPSIGFAELEVVAKAMASPALQPTEEFTVIPPREKMVRNRLTEQIHVLLIMGLSKSREVHQFVEHVATLDPDFPQRLKAGFVSEYNRLRASGLWGDALFLDLCNFSSGGSQEIKRKAAGLTVLAYLFECCEVFEK